MSDNIFVDPAVLCAVPVTDWIIQDPAILSIGPVTSRKADPSATKSTSTPFTFALVESTTVNPNTFLGPLQFPWSDDPEFDDDCESPASDDLSEPAQGTPSDSQKAERQHLIDFITARTFQRVAKACETEQGATAMAARFGLQTTNLPGVSEDEAKNTLSPARGANMKKEIFKHFRIPEFNHVWQFWVEKGAAAPTNPALTNAKDAADAYAARPKTLGEEIHSIKDFYQHFNNLPMESLKARGDSMHLFHLGVKPLWEDPRNARGGAYYFRVPRENAQKFWEEICVLATGDILQGAVETNRQSFNDEITGVTYSVRWNAVQIAVWNRDAANETGIAKLLEVILEQLAPEIRPKNEKDYWYKAHKAHKGFAGAA